MKDIYKIAKIVTSNLKRNSILPTFTSVLTNKEETLLSNIMASVDGTDDEMALMIYGTSADDTKYKMLKSRLRKKLLDYLFFIDASGLGTDDFYKEEISCLDLIHHARVLITQGEFDIALKLLNKVSAIATEYEFTEFAISSLELQNLCYVQKGLIKSLNTNYEELNKLKIIRDFEVKSTEVYQKAKILLNKSVSARARLLDGMENIVNEVEVIWKEAESYTAFENYYKLNVWYYELIGDFENIITIAENAYNLVSNNSINKKRFNERYNEYILVYSFLRVKSFEKGLKYASIFINNFNKDDLNWFSFMENYFLLCMHSKEYELAHSQISQVHNNISFSKISKAAKERWNLFHAYLRIVYPLLDEGKAFNFQAFIISVPEYSKDKQGFNVAILVLQFVYFLGKQDVEALLYRIESLKKYILTHLKESFSLRSKTFLKLLMLTVTEDFDANECRLKGQKHYQKLLETPTPGDAYAEIEIIPYEHLWEFIITTLEKRSN